MTKLPHKLTPTKNNCNKLISDGDHSKPAFKRNDYNGEIDGFDVNVVEYAKKF